MRADDRKNTRVLLRFYTELTVSGIFGENEVARVAQAFERITSQDLGQLNYLAVVVRHPLLAHTAASQSPGLFCGVRAVCLTIMISPVCPLSL